ncbi:hypothetical protein ACV3Q3_13005 [Clostridium perfringens]
MKQTLVCNNCGNKSKFYRDISISAKLRVNKYGEDLSQVYDIDKNKIDGYFDNIYCCNCGRIVLQEDEA